MQSLAGRVWCCLQGEVLNIGNPGETRIIDLARKIIGISNSLSRVGFHPFPPGEHRRRLPGTERAEKMIYWSVRLAWKKDCNGPLHGLRTEVFPERYLAKKNRNKPQFKPGSHGDNMADLCVG